MKFKVKITAGGISLFVADGVDNISFTESEDQAAVFVDHSLGDFNKWVISEIQDVPFDAGAWEPTAKGPKSYIERGLEKMEFIYITG